MSKPVRPLLFLDVDGVLNPVHPRPGGDFDAHQLCGFRVLISHQHGQWLRPPPPAPTAPAGTAAGCSVGGGQ